MPGATITLSEESLMRLEEILLDGDEKAALDFLRQLKAELARREKAKMRSEVERTAGK